MSKYSDLISPARVSRIRKKSNWEVVSGSTGLNKKKWVFRCRIAKISDTIHLEIESLHHKGLRRNRKNAS